MSAIWSWPGSRWWRVDLHTHSAASYDFKPDEAREAKDWASWVAAAKSAGLDAVALTDHNTPDGIAGILEAAAAQALTVFPGVEVTVGGIHLLCIFDPSRVRDDVMALLVQLGIQPAMFGHPEATSTKSIGETLSLATDAGALVVAAHINKDKGLLALPAGLERLNALKSPDLLAAEVCPARAVGTGWRDPEGPDIKPWLDGSKTEGRTLPQVHCSDGHALKDIGRGSTWVKMTRRDAEGLRLALLDGDTSLRPYRSGDDPNTHAGLAIENVTVRAAKYMGRARPLTVNLNPWLNVIIGGRGTGKSTIVDLCRATLRREAELGEPDSSQRSGFDNRMRIPRGRHAEGLLTEGTSVELVYRKDGQRFSLVWDRQGTTISQLDGDQRVAEDGDVRERFPVRIYSQKQLFDLAKAPDALLGIIDDSDDVGSRELARRRREAETTYLSLCAEARSFRAQAAELPAHGTTLVDLRRKLELLQRGGHAEVLNAYRARRRVDGYWTSVRAQAASLVKEVDRAADELAVADLELGPDGEHDSATAALQRAHAATQRAVEQLRDTVHGAVAAAAIELHDIRTGADATAWHDAVTESEEAYRTVTRQLADAGIRNPDEYRDLLQRIATLENEIAFLEQRRVAAEAREQDAAAALVRYRTVRSDLTARRQGFAARTAGDRIKIDIIAFAKHDPDAVEEFIRDTLGVQRFDEDHRALIDRIVPLAEGPWTFAALDALVAALRAMLGDSQQSWNAKDKRFEAALRKLQPERVDRLALLLPEDAVEVWFRDPRRTHTDWQRLEQGSPGQQTAALLAFVLGYGDEPIILDQPEDDLDSTLIYDVLVKRLRETKATRQIIVVTHNPNIVVHGDAELVVSLDTKAGQTQIAFIGGLQEQAARDEICRVMEGGRDAFKERYRRIMLPGEPRDGSR